MSGDWKTSRAAMCPVGRRVRAYVAPVNRDSETAPSFDPAVQGQFDPDNPPKPFLDLGWVENLQRSSTTKFEALRTGPRGMVASQCRTEPEALVEFEMPNWGKLAMAVSGGSQPMNVLELAVNGAPGPSGGTAMKAASLLDGSNMSSLILAPEEMARFDAGDMVAVDVDYAGETGYLGSGMPGAYLAEPLDASTHVDYVRRITFNLARVASKGPTILRLAEDLMGRVTPAMRVQKVVAFVDREGSSFFQEWSALFVVPADAGGRTCFFYPRMQAAQSTSETRHVLEEPVFGSMLHAKLRALPTVDPNDGETVLCYRSYFPEASAPVY